MIDEFHFEDEELEAGTGVNPTPEGLAHWIYEQYVGDDRFESVVVADPAPLDEEAVRVRFICDDASHFFVSVLPDEGIVRVGLATDNPELIESIETISEEEGLTLTEFLADSIETEDELEHEVQHFHDDCDYLCSEIPYQTEEDLNSDVLRDEIIYYLDGYITGLIDIVLEDEDDEEED